MGADDVVVFAEIGAGAGGDSLLPHVGVGRPLDKPLLEQLHCPLVEPPDLHHRRIEALEPLSAELHGCPSA
jgi:hypothetical protein